VHGLGRDRVPGTYGVDEPAGCYDDLDATDVVMLWGNNPAEMHPVLFSRLIDRRTRGERVTLIDIGTRRTRTTAHADHFLQFKPHGDLAIANGIMHLLIEERHLRPGLRRATSALPQADRAPDAQGPGGDVRGAGRPPRAVHARARGEALGRVREADIRMLGDLFGRPRREDHEPVVHGDEPAHARHGDQRARARRAPALRALRRPGDAPTSLTGQPSACGTVREVGTSPTRCRAGSS
jgi:nitrate reductase NapA